MKRCSKDRHVKSCDFKDNESHLDTMGRYEKYIDSFVYGKNGDIIKYNTKNTYDIGYVMFFSMEDVNNIHHTASFRETIRRTYYENGPCSFFDRYIEEFNKKVRNGVLKFNNSS